MLIRLDNFSKLLEKIAAGLAAILVVYLLGHIVLEIVCRFFSTSTYVLEQFSSYAMISITFLSLPYGMRTNSLVRVGFIADRITGKALWLLEIWATAATLFIIGTMTYYFWLKILWRDIKYGTLSSGMAAIPMWIPEILPFLSLIIFTFYLLITLLKTICDKGVIVAEQEEM